MKIAPIKQNPFNFGKKYKTEDVLRLLTGYAYKNKSSDYALIKSLTGVDIQSDEFQREVLKDNLPLAITMSIHSECVEKIVHQHPEFNAVLESFDCRLHLKQGRKAQDEWFKAQLEKLNKETDIKPFYLSRRKVEKRYKSVKSLLDRIF